MIELYIKCNDDEKQNQNQIEMASFWEQNVRTYVLK